jgi:ketosteroid isomerase-like protein
MNAYEQLIERLFSALSRGDFRSAADCYRDDSEFRDIAFNLKGQRDIAAMWHFVGSKRVDRDIPRYQGRRTKRLRALGGAIPILENRPAGSQSDRGCKKIDSR